MSSITNSSDIGPASEYIPSYEIRSYRTPAKVFHWLTAGLVFFMVALGVIAKQLDADPANDLIFGIHKFVGALTFCIVLLRLFYRFAVGVPKARIHGHRRPMLHWLLYAVIVVVPLLGWAGVSDFGALQIIPGFSLPAIWPKGAGFDEILLHAHAYLAFALLVLVALHIGVAIHDYMTDARPSGERLTD